MERDTYFCDILAKKCNPITRKYLTNLNVGIVYKITNHYSSKMSMSCTQGNTEDLCVTDQQKLRRHNYSTQCEILE